LDEEQNSPWKPFSRRHFLFALILLGALVFFLIVLPVETRITLLQSIFHQRLVISEVVFFALLTLSLIWSAGQRLDARIFLFFNLRGYHPHWIDRVMIGLTQIGNGVFGFILAGIFYLIGQRRLAVELVLGILSLWLLVEAVKALTDRDRPYIFLTNTRLIGWKERGMSFPSGHTAQTFFLMGFISHYYQLGLGATAILYGLGGIVGLTRIYIGVHYPRDVLAGATLGALWVNLMSLVDPFLVIRS